MADFLIAYAPLKAFEGGWCKVQGDAGGETCAGIARNFFPAWPGWPLVDAAKSHPSFVAGPRAFSAHLATLPALNNMITTWYRTEWWDRLGLANLPQALASELFEQAVNLGRGGSGRYLQRLCNALNRDKQTGQPLFADLAEDGAVGPKTLAALTILLAKRSNEAPLVHALNCLQGAHYIGLAANNSTQRQFMDGWMKRTHCPA